ncbi:hypothetical protein PBY51_015619 [Eleginops maclovinus]|uniref:Uncharacterized protein n=1 Tax=Eleginops maclovinus TaxID=56733 RepID=A0AAN8ALH1_ELEMC|nr:hypothetical protein PBY51_015619 [Eleginops maclovinus]
MAFLTLLSSSSSSSSCDGSSFLSVCSLRFINRSTISPQLDVVGGGGSLGETSAHHLRPNEVQAIKQQKKKKKKKKKRKKKEEKKKSVWEEQQRRGSRLLTHLDALSF